MAYEKNEIEKILKSGNGFTSDEIFKKSELFDSKVDLIRELVPQDKEDIVRFIDLQISVHQVQIDALLQKRASLTA